MMRRPGGPSQAYAYVRHRQAEPQAKYVASEP